MEARESLSVLVAGILFLAATAPAQWQMVQGRFLGSTTVLPAGDVDDDGVADMVLDQWTFWEVRSGATGAVFPELTRSSGGLGDRYEALQGDLDADGHDDLYFYSYSGSVIEFFSGRDGTTLFSVAMPGVSIAQGCADANADGADDVMVSWMDPTTFLQHYTVLSGIGGTQLTDFTFPTTSVFGLWMALLGDTNGDGYPDLLEQQWRAGQTNFGVKAGPDYQQWITTGIGQASKAYDTNADGRDELLTNLGFLDCLTGRIVWPGVFQMQYPMDLDGDGANDIWGNAYGLSGRTHGSFPGMILGWFYGIGDIDGDGRDEAAFNGWLVELVGGRASSRVRDRGASGHCSTQSRPRIRHRLRPRLGDSMLVDLNGGLGGGLAVLAIGAAVDIDLAPVGASGNRAYVSPIAFVGHVADAHGLTRHSIAVPNAAVFVGLPLSLQWVVCDPTANALGLATSNALDLVIGS